MPTYEYKCRTCGYTFEKFQSIKDKPLEKCPRCDGKVQRLISGGSCVIVKGSNSFETNYGEDNPTACGRDRPCCGRDTPCENKPCES